MNYILDTNAFVEASTRYYKKCICPGFWEWLVSEQNRSLIQSIDFIYNEISKKDDYLKVWAAQNQFLFMSSESLEIQVIFSAVAAHVADAQVYSEAEKKRFLDGADPWLISHAIHSGFTIVTHEVLVPDNSKKVKIPNICRAFGVSYCNTFELLENLQATFILGHRKTGENKIGKV